MFKMMRRQSESAGHEPTGWVGHRRTLKQGAEHEYKVGRFAKHS